VDARLDKDEAELTVLVLSVLLEVLADLDSLLDEHVEVLWDFRGKAVGLEDAEDFLAGHGADLGNSIAVTEDHTDLGGGKSLPGQLLNMDLNFLRRDLKPGGGGPLVRLGTLTDTFSGGVLSAHFVLLFFYLCMELQVC